MDQFSHTQKDGHSPEQSYLPVRKTLDQLGISRPRCYRGHERYRASWPEALRDRHSKPDRVWNRIGDARRAQMIELALEQPMLCPRELAMTFADS